MKYKKALIIGRFQPFHFGHLYLIKKTLEISEKIIIGIGSASIFDKNNPLDYNTREKIIKKVFFMEKIEDRLDKIVDLEDFFDDKKWAKNVIEKSGFFDILVSNNQWTNSVMEKEGFKIISFPFYRRYLYEGWRIRKLIKKNKKEWRERMPKYIVNFINSKIKFFKEIKEEKPFKKIVLGGTFDHFHKGHEALIKSSLRYGEKIIIGITSDNFVKNKFLSKVIENFKVRKNNVSNFLKKQKADYRASIIKINNFIGDLDKRQRVEAIIVSKDTYYNALKINNIRDKKGLEKLRIIILSDVLANDGKILSSERIRRGEIDRKGKSYWLLFNHYLVNGKKELILPESLREELRKPFGKIFNSVYEVINFIKSKKPIITIAVGDIIVKSLLDKNFNPNIKIIDFKSKRKPLEEKFQIPNLKLKKIFRSQVLNPKDLEFENSDLLDVWNFEINAFINRSGTINIKTAEKLKDLIKKLTFLKAQSDKFSTVDITIYDNNGWFFINGEEDLLALPAILFAPLGSLVLYGHWHYGIIGIIIDEKIKNKIFKIISQFN